MKKKIPVVNVQAYTKGSAHEQRDFTQRFGKSLQEFGFVIVEGHGVPPSLIADCYSQVESLFSLTDTQKESFILQNGKGQRGYIPFGIENAKGNSKKDLKEFWHVGREHFVHKAKEDKYPKNIWPTHDLPKFKTHLLTLYEQLDALAFELLASLSTYLGLLTPTLAQASIDGNTILRALHYPPLNKEQFDSGAIRAAAHEDINLLTILCEATDSGLQLLSRSGTWIDIETVPGQMVVDSGDMLSRITNNVIPSTTHRVINPKNSANRSRYSLPFFVHAFSEFKLDVLDICTSPSQPIKYHPITAGEFLLQRLKEIGL